MLNLNDLGKLSENDTKTLHELSVLTDICVKHNDAFTDEERSVLGKCIGLYIGTIESEMMQDALTTLVINKFWEQVKES